MKKDCYYKEFNTCTCARCTHCDSKCVGADACDCFVSGDDFFLKMMNGEIKEEKKTAEEVKADREKIRKNLSLGKTKKQLKYERRQEEAKNPSLGEGYALKDDPRFKDLFRELK